MAGFAILGKAPTVWGGGGVWDQKLFEGQAQAERASAEQLVQLYCYSSDRTAPD